MYLMKLCVMFLTMLKMQKRSIFQHKNISTVVVLLEKYTNVVFLGILFNSVSL